jgi:two-component system cell cycle sensor histidine kinase/response regulator CckA
MGDNAIPQSDAVVDPGPLAGNDTVAPEVMGRGESVEQFRELMEHLQQVFWIKNAKTKGVLYVSPAYEKIWGRTCESLYEDFQTLEDSIHPEDRERIAGAMDGDRDVKSRVQEFRILRPDGEIRWIRSRTYPVRNEEGEILRHAGINEDITDLKAAEKERSRLAAITEYSDDSFLSMSVDGIIISWNQGAERQYGYSAEEIIGHSVSVLFPPDHYREYLEVMKKVRQGEPMPSYETVRKRKDGTLVNMSVSISPIETRGGEVVGASKVDHNISRIKKLEAQFIEAQKMEVVGQLASGVAHDFNNILGVIIGYNDLITQRAAGLTGQLLVFSRKQTVQAVVLNLNEVVECTERMLRRFVDENTEMRVVCARGIGPIKADSGYIGQVLMNLVVNARDAMPHGGKLTIETSTVTLDENDTRLRPGLLPGAYVVLSVGDTGTGITEEVKAHLFEAFFTTKALGKGTGLGLTTCQTILQQSGGFIDVLSEVGKGTTFRAYFPCVHQPIEPVVEARQPGPLPCGTETLLLVEDEPALRQLAQSSLQIQGYKVLLASNGHDGLRVAREHRGAPIRLVITDVIMPKMSGKVMAEWLKTTDPNLKVLFTSGYTDDVIAHHGVLDKDVEFLPKPYTRSTLARKVREMLDTP